MKKVVKRLFVLILSAITAAGVCAGFSACSSNGGESNNEPAPSGGVAGGSVIGKWDEYDGVKVAFADEQTYNEGEIDESKILPELNCKLGEKYYMVVDFDIKADRKNDGKETVTADLKIQPAAAMAATIEDTNTGTVSNEINGDIREIKATYKIPENIDSVRNMRLVIQFEAKEKGSANIDLSFISSGEIQGVKTEKIKKSAILGYTEGLNYATTYEFSSQGNIAVKGFNNKNAEEIIIPSIVNGTYVACIENGAFEYYSNLNKVVIPDSVVSVGASAFNGCKKLSDIENGVRYVDKWVVECDKSVTQVSLRQGTRGIGYSAFEECNALTSVELPDGVVSIDHRAFCYCNELTNINIVDSVVRMGDLAFEGCGKLESVTIPDGVTSISESLFYDCESLTSIKIPKSVENIGRFAFSGCSSLTSIVIPKSVTKIGQSAFYGCNSKLSIKCEALVKPKGWDAAWNVKKQGIFPSYFSVSWGYSG